MKQVVIVLFSSLILSSILLAQAVVKGVVPLEAMADDPIVVNQMTSGMDYVQWSVDGFLIGPHLVAGNPYHYDWDSHFDGWSGAPLKDGPHELKAFAFDKAGNMATATKAMWVQNTPGLRLYNMIPPCRVMDTRVGSGFTGAFGPPTLTAGSKRTIPMLTNTKCPVPPTAKGYSLIVAIQPPGFVNFVTLGPTPLSLPPTYATLNGYVCAFSTKPCVQGMGTIVPAGINGSIDIYTSETTDIIIDINAYQDN